MLYLALFVPTGSPPHARSILDDPAIDRYIHGWGTQSGDSNHAWRLYRRAGFEPLPDGRALLWS